MIISAIRTNPIQLGSNAKDIDQKNRSNQSTFTNLRPERALIHFSYAFERTDRYYTLVIVSQRSDIITNTTRDLYRYDP